MTDTITLLLQTGPHHGPHGGAMGPFGGGGMEFAAPWGLLWIALWIGLFTAGLYLLATRTDNRNPSEPTDPVITLERRYARGEIDEEEFDERRAKLLHRTRS
ncbi:SHOCT domain-containing protein [Halosimplex sp. J119]